MRVLLSRPRRNCLAHTVIVSTAFAVINPPKGIINTATAIPKGILNIVGSIHEGFANLPKAYGSDVRQSGKVTDFSTGMKEGAKGLFYGCKSYQPGLLNITLISRTETETDGAVRPDSLTTRLRRHHRPPPRADRRRQEGGSHRCHQGSR